jgi:hypothetical protein
LNTLYCLEEWRGEQKISSSGDNFTPRGQNLPMGDNFAPGGQSLPLGAKLRMGLRVTTKKQNRTEIVRLTVKKKINVVKEVHTYMSPIGGRCYDHNFLRFSPIFGEKIVVFLKNQCYDQFFKKVAVA